jgi:hypothetical protein
MTKSAGDGLPIACTLTGGDYRERLAWIAELNRDALRAQRRDDLRLDLTYRPEAATRVRDMVRREQACCGFLAFTLREDADATRLTIVVPEAAREGADFLLAPFQSTLATGSSCPCAATAETGAAPPMRSASGSRVGAIAAVTACGALACAACCVVPFALPAVILASAGGLLAWLAGAAGWTANLALIAVAGGWVWIGWESARTRAMPAKSTLYAMAAATLALALAFGWPLHEAPLLRLIAGA